MDLVIGGACQNKRQAACAVFNLNMEDIADGSICGFHEIFRCRALSDFHLLIRRMLEEGKDTQNLIQEIIGKNPNIVIISDEIGYGIVPMDARLREWRERTGRICCEAAAASEHVVRVVAGIPQFIKGA